MGRRGGSRYKDKAAQDLYYLSVTLLLPSPAPALRGCGGSRQLLGEVSWHSLTLLPGPSEEVAVAVAEVRSAAAPALGGVGCIYFLPKALELYIYFLKPKEGKSLVSYVNIVL